MTNNKLLSLDVGGMYEQLQNQSTPLLPSSGTTIGTIVNRLLIYVFPLAGIVVFFYLIYGGYQYLMSAGDPKAAAGAKQTLTYAIIGFLVMFAAYFVVQAFGYALGLPAITNMF